MNKLFEYLARGDVLKMCPTPFVVPAMPPHHESPQRLGRTPHGAPRLFTLRGDVVPRVVAAR